MRENEKGCWRELHCEALYDLCFPDMQMIMSGRMGWLWNVAGVKEKTNTYRVLVE